MSRARQVLDDLPGDTVARVFRLVRRLRRGGPIDCDFNALPLGEVAAVIDAAVCGVVVTTDRGGGRFRVRLPRRR